MREAIKRRVTYANVASTLALFVALGGGSALALSDGEAGKGAGAPTIKKFNFAANGDKNETILTAGELKLKAKCAAQLNLLASTGQNNAVLQSYGNGSDADTDDFDKETPVDLFDDGSSTGSSSEERDVVYRTANGQTVALQFVASDDLPHGGTKACVVSGFAIY